MPALPLPSPHQTAASQALLQQIEHAIAKAGGWISFADYMRLALYSPGLGYYSGGSQKFGAAGDFITAPELSPLFGRALAQPVAQVLQAVGGSVLEVGAGSGRLAVDVLAELERLGQLPEQYLILELSAELAERQRSSVAAELPHLLPRLSWLQALPVDFVGCIIGNEVLDAMPCRLVRKTNAAWLERGVSWEDGLRWQDRPLADLSAISHLQALDLPDDYLTEILPEACAFVRSLAAATARGALILPDYGFAAGEFYHPQRNRGTLMCHYRHHSHDDPFYLPGLQDITCHVDFSAIWRAGDAAGWQLEGFTSQASFLLDAGILQLAAELEPQSAAYLKSAAALNKLLGPAEMGELFKVIGFSKGLPLDHLLAGFRRDDRSGSL